MVLSSASCAGRIVRQYEYEEDVFLALDGSATVYVNASVPALVAHRGLELDTNPRALVDRAYLRRVYAADGVRVSRVTFSRRRGRRFVHLRLDVDHVRRLANVGPLDWSTYRFDEEDGAFAFRQVVGTSKNVAVGDVGWRGEEIAGFRIHIPSRVLSENAPGAVERGNILVWEQSFGDRTASIPLVIEVRMERSSILSRTLLLFAASAAAALLTLGALIYWTVRKGRTSDA